MTPTLVHALTFLVWVGAVALSVYILFLIGVGVIFVLHWLKTLRGK